MFAYRDNFEPSKSQEEVLGEKPPDAGSAPVSENTPAAEDSTTKATVKERLNQQRARHIHYQLRQISERWPAVESVVSSPSSSTPEDALELKDLARRIKFICKNLQYATDDTLILGGPFFLKLMQLWTLHAHEWVYDVLPSCFAFMAKWLTKVPNQMLQKGGLAVETLQTMLQTLSTSTIFTARQHFSTSALPAPSQAVECYCSMLLCQVLPYLEAYDVHNTSSQTLSADAWAMLETALASPNPLRRSLVQSPLGAQILMLGLG